MIPKVQKLTQCKSQVGTKGKVTAQTCPNYAQTETESLRGNDRARTNKQKTDSSY